VSIQAHVADSICYCPGWPRVNFSKKDFWLGTVRGWAGLAVENVLAYMTIGLAIGDVSHSWTRIGNSSLARPELGGVQVGYVANARGILIELRDTAYITRLGLNYRPAR
jgi:opacity protein-like surface antigen